MCPLVNELKRRPQVQTVVCVTGQHKQMLQQVLDAFSVVPDYDLAIMQPNQTLFDVTTAILTRIQAVLILFPIKNAPNPLPTSNTDDCIF